MKRVPKEIQLHGLLPLNKPPAMITKDVSRWLQKRLGRQKVGHVGTLDPLAEGVLLVLFGSATRLQDFLMNQNKTYEFDIEFGYETDTLDSQGEVIKQGEWQHLSFEVLQSAVKKFTGEILQIPPIYSAIKYKGAPLYRYARGKKEVPVQELARKVKVHQFEVLSFSGRVGTFRATCSKGTYIRSLARDIASNISSLGTISRLVRTHHGPIKLETCVKFGDLDRVLEMAAFEDLLLPIEKIDLGFLHWTAIETTRRLRNGQTVSLQENEFLQRICNRRGEAQVDSPCRIVKGIYSEPICLLDDRGRIFGIGSVKKSGNDRVLVHMERGLI